MKTVFLLALVSLVFVKANSSFSNKKPDIKIEAKKQVFENQIIENKSIKPVLKTSNSFEDFKKHLAFKESSNVYDTINRFGYVGLYQFGTMALKDLGLTKKEIRRDIELQHKAFKSLCMINKYRMRKYFKYVGKNINGIKITESGMLASAHLVGSNAVKRYLSSGGRKISYDANKTTIEHYMKMFANYDVSEIKPKRKISLKRS